ncbi:MAG: PEP-CTERM sorting domain-containing protein [Fimbriimonadaceae bacterium]
MFKPAIAVFLLVLATGASAQIVLGQVDTFQDGTAQFWIGGGNIINQPNGGPAGAGDRFLSVESFGGLGGGSRLAMFNNTQWTGDFQGAGVTAVSLHMRNLGQTDLQMRLVLFDFTGGDTRWTSTVAQPLLVGGNWQSMVFSVLEADLTRAQGAQSYADLIVDVDRMMFRHQAGGPGPEGDPIVAMAGFDNIRAVPEPATFVALGLGALLLRRRK